MNILVVILVLVVVGVIMYLVNTKFPMDETYKLILNVIILILVILWILSAFGLMSYFNVRVGRLG